MDIKELEQIISILKQNDVAEFELTTQEGTHIKLSRGLARAAVDSGLRHIEVQPAIIPHANGQMAASSASANAASTPAQPESHLKPVESPIVGTFYRKPSPDAEPFVKEGNMVKKGDTLCIVEAMKLMNEIEAPCSGRVVKSLLQDGQVVEYGEVLFLIDPTA
jgi:acetyl-CoA carboxylase biotin carboxyl carrier protein